MARDMMSGQCKRGKKTTGKFAFWKNAKSQKMLNLIEKQSKRFFNIPRLFTYSHTFKHAKVPKLV